MKNLLSGPFKSQLCDAVKNLERRSQAEIVVLIRAQSGDYRDLAMVWGALGALALHSYAIFSPQLLTDQWVYLAPIIGFALGYLLTSIPLLLRLSVSPKRKHKQVEIMARALFQKGGLANTQAKIGILIYFSWLEQCVYVLPDQGAKLAIPLQAWQILQHNLQRVFQYSHPELAILEQLQTFEPILAQYLPKRADDFNELPDDLEITL